MKQFYFTFGFGHWMAKGHDPVSLASCYTIVEAEDERQARDKMYEHRGNKWAFCYDSAEKAGVERFNLKLVPFDEVSPQPGETL